MSFSRGSPKKSGRLSANHDGALDEDPLRILLIQEAQKVCGRLHAEPKFWPDYGFPHPDYGFPQYVEGRSALSESPRRPFVDLIQAFPVSVPTRRLQGRFWGPGLCVEKCRSRQPDFRGANGHATEVGMPID